MPRRRRPESSRQRIARHILALRNAHGFTQAMLGERAGLHRTYIGAVERAEVNISADNIDRIARALAVDPSALLAP